MLTAEITRKLAGKFGKNDKDTGNPAVQVAFLTERINSLAPHFEKNPKDYSGNRGLMKMIGQRKNLLRYLQLTNAKGYTKVITELGLRK